MSARHTPPSADGNCSGRYASYWNAFLSNNVLCVGNQNLYYVHYKADIMYEIAFLTRIDGCICKYTIFTSALHVDMNILYNLGII